MVPKALWQRKRKSMFVVAPASASTWAVAFSRRLIPGALFTTRAAAVIYAFLLATAAGLDHTNILVVGDL
jgi:hypothetical protein